MLPSLEEFGAKIIESPKSIDLVEPHLSPSPKELLSLFQSVSQSRQLEVGICNAMWSLVETSLPNFSDAEKLDLQKRFIETFALSLDPLSLEGISDAAILLYRRMDRNWPDLEAFIFKTLPRPAVVGPLFVRFMSCASFEFVREKTKEIVEIINDLIEIASFQVQTAMIILLARLDEGVLDTCPGLFDKMWKAALGVIGADNTRASKLYIPLDELYKNGDLATRVPKVVTEAIDGMGDDWNKAKPVLRMLPYVPIDTILVLFEKLKGSVAKHRLVELVELVFDEAPLADMPDEVFLKLIRTCRTQSDDAGFAIYAAFAAVASETNILEEILLRKSEDRVTVALKSLEYMSEDNSDLDFAPPDEVINATIAMLHDDSPMLRKAAFGAMKALIVNDVFIEPPNANHIISQFTKIRAEDIGAFFDLLHTLLRVDGLAVEAVEHVFDFAYITIRSEKCIRECLSLFNTISETGDQNMVECVIDDVLPFAKDLVTHDDVEDFRIGIVSLIHYVVIAPEIVGDAVRELLPTIKQSTKTSKDNITKGFAGRLWAAAAGEYELVDEYMELESLVREFLASRDETLMMSAAMMGCSLVKEAKIFEILCNSAKTIRDTKILNIVLKTLRKFLKEHEGLDAMPLAKLFISETHPVFNRRPASAFSDTDTQIYAFLTAVNSDEIEPTLLRWFTDAPFPMISRYLGALDKLEMTPKYYAEWAKVLSRKLMNTSVFLKEIILGFIMKILEKDKTALDLDFFASQLLCLWNKSEEDDPGWRAALGTGILEVCAMGGEMDDDVFEDILSDYPFDVLYGKCEPASVALVKMMDSGNWEYLNVPVALCFAQMLTMSVQKLKTYQLTEATRKDMIRTVRKIFKENPTIERMSKDQLGSNKMLLKRLEVLATKE